MVLIQFVYELTWGMSPMILSLCFNPNYGQLFDMDLILGPRMTVELSNLIIDLLRLFVRFSYTVRFFLLWLISRK